MTDEAKCPFPNGVATRVTGNQSNAQWWPNQLNCLLYTSVVRRSDATTGIIGTLAA